MSVNDLGNSGFAFWQHPFSDSAAKVKSVTLTLRSQSVLDRSKLPQMTFVFHFSHHPCPSVAWYHMLQTVLQVCSPADSVGHTQSDTHSAFLPSYEWYFCHNSSANHDLIFHSSFLACFCGFPTSVRPHLDLPVWIPSHLQSSWWSAGMTCPWEAPTEIATIGWGHFLQTQTNYYHVMQTAKNFLCWTDHHRAEKFQFCPM